MDTRPTTPRLMPGALLVLLPGALLAFAVWQDGLAGGARDTCTTYGEALSIGDGTARTYATFEAGRPVEFGVALSERAMDGLPDPMPGVDYAHHVVNRQYLLRLPVGIAETTPYRLVELDWNPGGHEPPGIYDRPHFDFHFYTITEAERNRIDPADPLFQQKAERLPPDGYMPASFMTPPPVMAVPRMGVHWIDPSTPELNGQIFTTTFIWGSWDGRVIFTEPMITRDYLLQRGDFTAPIGTPARYQGTGSMPTAYRVYWVEASKEYRVALTQFVPTGN